MQGLWKEKLGGYNHKGAKRKKQARKHTLKDKIVAINKLKLPENAYYVEKNCEVIYNTPVKVFTTHTINKHLVKIEHKTNRSHVKAWIDKKDYDAVLNIYSIETCCLACRNHFDSVVIIL